MNYGEPLEVAPSSHRQHGHSALLLLRLPRPLLAFIPEPTYTQSETLKPLPRILHSELPCQIALSLLLRGGGSDYVPLPLHPFGLSVREDGSPGAMVFLTDTPSLRWKVCHGLSSVILLRLCGLPVPHGDLRTLLVLRRQGPR